MENKFQIFGSKSSIDYDVVVFIDDIPNICQSQKLCEEFNKHIKKIFKKNNFKTKKINSNLAVLKNGIIVKTFKGTSDEVNNSLYSTYSYHKQLFENQIKRLIKRDIELKLLRAVRIILSFLSRTEYRIEVKKALKSNFSNQLITLAKIDLSLNLKFGDKKQSKKDIYKTIAFQIGQVLGLASNKEFYSKESISSEYPSLKKFLDRDLKNANFALFEAYKSILIDIGVSKIKELGNFDEQTYKILSNNERI